MDFMLTTQAPFSGANLKFDKDYSREKKKKRRPFTAPVDVSKQRTPNALPLKYNLKNMHDIRMERTAVRMNQRKIVDQKKNTSTYTCKEAKELLDLCVKKEIGKSTSDLGSEVSTRQKPRHTSAMLITKSYYGTSVPTFFDGKPKGQKLLYKYPKNTGPTYKGSPMHSERAKEMSELKNLPKDNLQDIHDRAQSCPPQIKQRLKEYDKTFRVQPSIYSPDGEASIISGMSSCQYMPQAGTDYILIPLDSSRRTSRQSFDTKSMNPRSRMASQQESELPVIEESKSVKSTAELTTKEASAAEVIPPVTNRKSEPSVQGIKSIQSKMEMDTENEMPMTEEGEEVVEKPLVYPDTFKCWVDDATVSSIPKSQPEVPEPEPEPEEPTKGKKVKIDDKKKGKDKGKDKKKGKKGKEPEPEPEPEPAPPPEPEPPPPVVEEPIVIIEEPPNYICPRSESKSREAETRKWLESNSFPYALHSMPLF